MADLFKNLFPFWISPPTTSCVPTEVTHPKLVGLTDAYVVKSEDVFENELKRGFPQSFSPIAEFNCGVGYLVDIPDAVDKINYASLSTQLADGGRIIPNYPERFGIEGLNGFYVNGNGEFVMSSFIRNGKPCYLNTDGWAVWYDNSTDEWVLTDALHYHPSKTDYNYTLRNGDSDPTTSIYKTEDQTQHGYGSNTAREQLVANIPLHSYEGKIQKIASSKTHTLFLDTDGSVWGVGNNKFNQLGTTNSELETIPHKLSETGISDIIATDNITFLIKMNGAAFAVGPNEHGECGVDLNELGAVVRNVGGYLYKDNFGKLDSFNKIAGGTADDLVVSIKASRKFAYVLKIETLDGIRRKTLYSCGINSHGQLGLNHYYDDPGYGVGLSLVASDSIDNDIMFDVGESHAMWIRQGRLFGVGKSDKHQVGSTNETSSFYEQPHLVTDFDGVMCRRVACGSNFTLALLEDNTLWATGDNAYGQCGIPNSTPVLMGFRKVHDDVRDFSAGHQHSLILTYSNKLLSAGNNQFGQCATEVGFAELSESSPLHSSNGYTRCQLHDVNIDGLVSYIYASGDSSFFIVDEKIYGVGFNVNGNLGLGLTSNVSVTTELTPAG